MKIATLVHITDDEINGDLETFNVSTSEGMQKAHSAFSDRVLSELYQVKVFRKGEYVKLTSDEIREELSDAFDAEYEFDNHGQYIALFFSELIEP